MGHAQLAVVGGARDHRPRAQRARVGGVAERGQQAPDLLVDDLVQVGVEVDVVAPGVVVVEGADVGRLAELHQRVHGRLVAQVLVDGRRQRHAQVAELRARVAPDLVLRRVAEHVVRVDQRDDEAERLGQVLPGEPPFDLARVVGVPALVRRAGVAAAERLGLGVAAGVRRLPVGEAVVALDALGVGVGPLAPVDRLAQVPLALQGDVVAALAQVRRERVDPRRQLRLPAALRAEAQQPAYEAVGQALARDLPASGQARHRAQHVGQVALVGEQVALGQREGHAMPRRIGAGQEAGPARRAHRRRREGAVEADPGAAQLGVVGHQLVEPGLVGGPVLRRALLVGDQQDQVGLVHRPLVPGEPVDRHDPILPVERVVVVGGQRAARDPSVRAGARGETGGCP